MDDRLEEIKACIKHWKNWKSIGSPGVYWLIGEVERLRRTVRDLEQEIEKLTGG